MDKIEINVSQSPSLNELLNMPIYKKKETKAKIYKEISKILWSLETVPRFKRAKVTYIRYGKKLLDKDNLIGGTKFYTDVFVKWKIIPNDDPKNVVIDYLQEIGDPLLKIIITNEHE